MPPYPLYGETTTALPGSSSSTPLHTHSNKFPIEREVVLSCADKNTKIPILQEYRRKERSKTMATISPDIPNKLIAWTNANNAANGPLGGDSRGVYGAVAHQSAFAGGAHTGAVARTYDSAPRGFLPGETQLAIPVLVHSEHAITRALDADLHKAAMGRAGASSDMVTRHFPTELRDEKSLLENLGNTSSLQELTDTKLSKDLAESEKNKAFPTRTYHTLKGMISSRFTKSKDLSEASLNKSSSSLAETSNMVTLNNMDREGTRSTMGKDEHARVGELSVGQMPGDRESAYSRMPSLSEPRSVQSGGQCVVNMETKANAIRVLPGDSVHATNQAVYAERNAISNSTPKQGEIMKSQAFYADHNHRKPNTSQYAKPNTQQTHYPDQSSGIYMVMRQGRAQYPSPGPAPAPDKSYQTDVHQSQNAPTSGYSQHNFLGHNGSFQALGTPTAASPGQSKLAQQHNTVLNKMGGFSQHHYPMQQISPNTYQALPMGNTSTNEALPMGGQIGPGLTYQHQAATNLKMNGAIGSSNTYTKEAPIGSDHLDGSKDVYSNKNESVLPGEYGIKEEKSATKKGANGGFRKSKFSLSGVGSGSGQSSDYDKTNVDSGRGSAISGQQMNQELAETSEESSTTPQGNDADWVDLVESELRQILDPHTHHQSTPLGPAGCGNNSTISDSISSMTPPLPPLSPGGGAASRYKLSHNSSGMYGIKQDYGPIDGRKTSQAKGRSNASSRFNWSKSSDRNKSALLGGSVTDITSTTGTGLDSLLDEDVATSIATGDARAIRHQLEGLENMYSQVLQLLGVKRQGMKNQGYQPSDPRFNKRRFHGSVSSVPSSVSSRPIRDKRRQDERKKVKDIKGINKRFQRLESHVVTLARSVAHLSSEMRTQHLMIQEMENIRSELSALRTHTMATANRSQSMPRLSSALSSLPSITNPTRVKKLTKFFGDEPPLLRLFLKKLGYEKYASVFECEQVGMVELPYMSEERLQSMGIPLGPRLRILQEAHVSVLTNDQLCVI